jgi:hypothetical protein
MSFVGYYGISVTRGGYFEQVDVLKIVCLAVILLSRVLGQSVKVR